MSTLDPSTKLRASRPVRGADPGVAENGRPAVGGLGTPAATSRRRPRRRVERPAAGARARVRDVSRLAPHRASLRDSRRRRALALTDIAALGLAYAVVWWIVPPPGSLASLMPLIGALPLWVLINKLLGLYDRDANVIRKSTLDEVPRITQSVVLGASLMFLLSPLVPQLAFGRAQTLVLMLAGLLLVPVLRSCTRAAFNHWGSPERCLIVGDGPVAQQLTDRFTGHPEYRIQLVGCLANQAAPNDDGDEAADAVSDFERICKRLDVERVIIIFASLREDDLLALVQASKQLNLKITVVPPLFESIGDGIEVDNIHGVTSLGLRGLSRTRSSLCLKRAGDILLTTIGLLVLAPAMVLVAAAIRLTSRGPVFFSQLRIGRDNRPFHMFKFRTMCPGAEDLKPGLAHLNEAAAPMFKIADDPRVTRVGQVLRRFSFDELPQLFNVLRGEMSLVGPRPLVPSEDEWVIGRHRERLDLTPGLTGPWQVMRTAIPFDEMIRLDYQYVAQWSLWNDVKLLLRTAPVILSGKGH